MTDKWSPQNWWKFFWGFWWLRGALCTLFILGLLLTFVPNSVDPLLNFIHHFIFGWNRLMGGLGRLIGLLPFVPELSAVFVNTIALAISLVIPATISLCAWIDLRQAFDDLTTFDQNAPDPGAELLKPIRFLRFIQFCLVLALLSISVGFYGALTELDVNPDMRLGMRVFIATFFFLYVALMIYLVARKHPPFFKGIVMVLLALFVLEVLFQARLGLGEALDSLTCLMNPSALPEC
ncbi:hypothetical protein PVV74_13800 [Roseovarius sp. SK2]|uniref:hypothetical protein n=1 Tax=Roseovarius TaxID=74030 RepID=UPI00237BEC49|nr:hypothetical protein [Roseovarius sp. SK2]MDD9726539.1 hypothetical protein [Roseovarius sp. SK2]